MLYGNRVNMQDKNDPLTMIAEMVRDESRVADVGCGVGNLAAFLTRAKRCLVTAVEVSPIMAEIAEQHCQAVIIGSVEDTQIQQRLRDLGPYDYIIFADVLEHLVDPCRVLVAVHSAMAPGARVLVSLPNVAHYSVRLGLAVGRFDYTDGYLLDRNHLRFFTRSSAKDMFARCGYEVEQEMVHWVPHIASQLPNSPVNRRLFGRLATKLAAGLLGYQFVYSLRESRAWIR